jgi:hypothetical protein
MWALVFDSKQGPGKQPQVKFQNEPLAMFAWLSIWERSEAL